MTYQPLQSEDATLKVATGELPEGSFRTMLLVAAETADEISIAPATADGRELALLEVDHKWFDDKSLTLEWDSEHQAEFPEQEIVIDRHGEAKVKDTEGGEWVLDFAVVKSMTMDDVRTFERVIAAAKKGAARG